MSVFCGVAFANGATFYLSWVNESVWYLDFKRIQKHSAMPPPPSSSPLYLFAMLWWHGNWQHRKFVGTYESKCCIIIAIFIHIEMWLSIKKFSITSQSIQRMALILAFKRYQEREKMKRRKQLNGLNINMVLRVTTKYFNRCSSWNRFFIHFYTHYDDTIIIASNSIIIFSAPLFSLLN